MHKLMKTTMAEIILAASAWSASAQTAFPLKLSENHHYLVDQKGKPFLMVGDTPQGLMGQLTEQEADYYFADREAHGFNTLGWIDVMCAGNDYPLNKEATTRDGIKPFNGYLGGGTDFTHYDLSKPNEAYFTRLEHIIQLAQKHHLLVFINPIETIGWLPALRNNGEEAAYKYGQYLGNRYKGLTNVAWLNGNDFNLWTMPDDDNLVQAVSKGIRSMAPNQLQSVELNVRTSSSFDDPRWIPLIEINGTYTYSPTYIQMLHSYNQKPIAPVYMMEAHYEWENVGEPPDFGTPYVLRKQDYWTMLTGGFGQWYGNKYTWSFADGWRDKIDTPGVEQLGICAKFFSSLPWQDLAPDQDHKVLIAGYGAFGSVDTRVSESDYATAARTKDGSTVVVYVPTVRSISIEMSSLRGAARARWFDPSDGSYREIVGGSSANHGSRAFTAPGNNHAGDGDWVLLLQARSAGR